MKKQIGWAVAFFVVFAYLINWQFAAFIMIILAVHEYGHIWAMKRYGVETGGMYFIPFLGCVAPIKSHPPTQEQEVISALMGPAWGGLCALPLLAAWYVTHDILWLGLVGFVGFINLFNLLFIPPMDGGRVVRAILFAFIPRAHNVWGPMLLVTGLAILMSTPFKSPIILIALLWFGLQEFRARNGMLTMAGHYEQFIDRVAEAFPSCEKTIFLRLLERTAVSEAQLLLSMDEIEAARALGGDFHRTWFLGKTPFLSEEKTASSDPKHYFVWRISKKLQEFGNILTPDLLDYLANQLSTKAALKWLCIYVVLAVVLAWEASFWLQEPVYAAFRLFIGLG